MSRDTGVETWHSFSFGRHYDPGNVGFGPLVCHDEHFLEPGHGFPPHPHRDVEIVTWVVAGSLVHDGSSTVRPGQVAVQSAGAGVTHSEVAGPEGCRFVQVWLRPDAAGGTPARAVAAVEPVVGRVTPLVGAGAPVSVRVAGAALGVVRLGGGGSVALPAAPLRHVFVVAGEAVVAGVRVGEGDAVRLTDEPDVRVTTEGAAELLVWSFDHKGHFE